jgi:hypothetical protein
MPTNRSRREAGKRKGAGRGVTKKMGGINLRGKRHPVLYEVNARVLLAELLGRSKKQLSLADLPDRLLDEWAGLGFDGIWMMGVWSTGPVGVRLAREHAELNGEFRKALPDMEEADIVGSPYAVRSYVVSPALGGNDGLARLRRRLADRGIGLVLDFVCNHTARDHQWVSKHPEYYVQGRAEEDRTNGDAFFCTGTASGERVLAFGRDPTFAPWTDTAQLEHRCEGLRRALIGTLKDIAEICDGVRCDMAMLVLERVFAETWNGRASEPAGVPARGEFWADAIQATRASHPDFLFIAEAYWGLEWELQQLGFDFTYDKTLYDRLLREGAGAVRDHLKAEMKYQQHSLRFLENHDERRAAEVLPSAAWHCAAALVTSTVPGMVMYHEGQLDGRKIKVPVQLARRPREECSPVLHAFYERLLSCIRDPVFQRGEWRLLSTRSAWNDNHTWQNFLVYWWQEGVDGARLIVVNYAPLSGQCYVDFPLDLVEGTPLEFRDLLGDAVYVRDRAKIASRGMYFDLPAYGLHLFRVRFGRRP